MKDHYKVLKISSNASQEEIKKSYKKLMREFHPDINKTLTKEKLNKKSAEINNSYDILGNPEKRREYDIERNEYIKRKKSSDVYLYFYDVEHSEILNGLIIPASKNDEIIKDLIIDRFLEEVENKFYYKNMGKKVVNGKNVNVYVTLTIKNFSMANLISEKTKYEMEELLDDARRKEQDRYNNLWYVKIFNWLSEWWWAILIFIIISAVAGSS